MSKIKTFIYALSTLSGTIIGVGFFALPYITLKTGIWIMLVYFLVLGSLVIIVHLLFGELSLRTPDLKRLPGFAQIYLGKWGKNLAIASTIFGLFGAILAYLIVGGEFFGSLLSPIFGGSNFLYTILYFIAGAGIIYFGIKAISKIEFWGLILFLVILFLIFFQSKSFININNLFLGIGNWKLGIRIFFLPYGPILFSLWGAALIPEAEEMLKEKKYLLRKIIPFAILIPAVVYLFFICLVLGVTGSQTTESAMTGLRNFLGGEVVSLGLFFGVLTTFTSFIALGLTLKKVFWYDLKIEKNLAWAITCFVPLILFLAGIKSFISVISFVGGVMLGIDGILILLMYKKLKTAKFQFLTYPLILIFVLGVIYEIIYFIK